jgi:hypothetical protein
MVCPSCRSVKQAEFTAEMIIHSPGLKNIDRPSIWLFPELLVCLDCGFCRFTVSETELASIAEGTLADKSSTLEESAGDVAFRSGMAS